MNFQSLIFWNSYLLISTCKISKYEKNPWTSLTHLPDTAWFLQPLALKPPYLANHPLPGVGENLKSPEGLTKLSTIFLEREDSMKWLVYFNPGKTQLALFDWSSDTGAIDWKWMSLFLRKKMSSKMQGLTLSSRLDWGFYIISVAETASKKIGALIRSMKSLSPEVVLYLYKSTIWLYMEHSCHVWASVPSCYSELLDKLQK